MLQQERNSPGNPLDLLFMKNEGVRRQQIFMVLKPLTKISMITTFVYSASLCGTLRHNNALVWFVIGF